MASIEAWFESEEAPLVLLGMGGAGKSQLALEFGRKVLARPDCSPVIWIDARSPTTVQQSLKNAVSKLCDDDRVSDDVELNLSRITKELKSKRWLTIFDNFDDPEAFHEHRLSWYFPREGRGRILITSRHSGSVRLGKPLELSTMTETESLALLLQRPIHDSSQHSDGLKIASTLGDLPLALDQAGSYIRARGVRLEDFLDHYEVRKKQILQELPYQWEYRRNDMHTNKESLLSAFTTWELSFEQIRGDEITRKAKEHFLTISAFFDLNSISREFFKAYCTSSTAHWTRIFRRDNAWDDFSYGAIVAEYQALSLVQAKEHNHDSISGFTFHPVVQEWLKLRINDTQRLSMVDEFTKLLCIYIQSTDLITQAISLTGMAITNINTCLTHQGRSDDGLERSAGRLFCAVSEFWQSQTAIDLVKPTPPGCQQPPNDNELPVLRLLDRVAGHYRQSGNLHEASKAQEVALAMAQSQLGLGHHTTICMMKGLSLIYSEQGLQSKAISILKLALEITERRGDRTTIDCLIRLGKLYFLTAEYELARPVLLKAEKLCKEVDGISIAMTLDTLLALGVLYTKVSDWERAEQVLKRALTYCQKSVGPAVHVTGQVRLELATIYLLMARFDESEFLLREVLAAQDEAFITGTVSGYRTMLGLTICCTRRGAYGEAQQRCQQALSVSETVCGMEHQDTTVLPTLQERIQAAIEEEEAMTSNSLPLKQQERSTV